jgi:hypothetical protein
MNAPATTAPRVQEVDVLALRWLEAKRAEHNAQKERIAIEAQICASVGLKDEGSTTLKTDCFKVTTTGKINRSVDVEELIKVAAQLPAPIVDRLIRHKAEVVVSELRYVQENEPEAYKLIARFLTAKPAKPAVAVEAIE